MAQAPTSRVTVQELCSARVGFSVTGRVELQVWQERACKVCAASVRHLRRSHLAVDFHDGFLGVRPTRLHVGEPGTCCREFAAHDAHTFPTLDTLVLLLDPTHDLCGGVP